MNAQQRAIGKLTHTLWHIKLLNCTLQASDTANEAPSFLSNIASAAPNHNTEHRNRGGAIHGIVDSAGVVTA